MTASREDFHPDVSRGLLTRTDLEWLNGQKQTGKTKQKNRCQARCTLLIQDIKELVENDLDTVSNLETLGELFEDVESETDLTLEDAASYLIALAFILCNDNLDYADLVADLQIHSADGVSPNDPDRPKRLGLLQELPPVDDMLMFRRALGSGIRRGKARYDAVPDPVTVAANTELYKEPTNERLNRGFDTDMWRDVTSSAMDGASRSSNEDQGAYDKETALQLLRGDIQLAIEREIGRRKARTDAEIVERGLDF